MAHALLTLQTGQLVIIDTETERAEALARALCARFGAERARAGGELAAALAGSDGLVNATPVGMAKFLGMPLPGELLSPRLWVADLIYFPLETELLREARRIGCRTLSGAGMAVHQAAGAFRLFTGEEPDVTRMLRSFGQM